ncbi:MAG: peptide deformylase [Paracoccaceae bacterium]|nr:peptide deformylase [Paracoccaceae bacterium]
MAVRRCIPWPDPRLRHKAAPVSEITDDIRAIWQDMVDTMEDMPGVGLAAPQIGKMLRLAVADASESQGEAILMANPEILQRSKDLFEFYEASPNLPGVAAKMKRSKVVSVRFLNVDGLFEQRDFEDLWSTSVQHQIDHLNGKMFFDSLSKVRRDMLLRKVRKAK